MDQSFNTETLLASLRDIRLPHEAAGGLASDVLVSIGLGALAALVCVALLRLVFRPRAKDGPLSLAQEVGQAMDLPPKARRVALLHVLKRAAPERYQAVAKDLYAPGQLDLARLEAEVARLV